MEEKGQGREDIPVGRTRSLRDSHAGRAAGAGFFGECIDRALLAGIAEETEDEREVKGVRGRGLILDRLAADAIHTIEFGVDRNSERAVAGEWGEAGWVAGVCVGSIVGNCQPKR